MTSYIPCKKNGSNGYVFYVSLISQADTKLFQANPTLAAGDVKIAKDDGVPVNLASLPAVDADFTKRVKVILSQAETNADNITIIFSDAIGSEWVDLIENIQTSAQTFDEIIDLIADAVWDEVLTGATHNITTSAGRRLRTIGTDAALQRENTCQAGEDASHVKLDTGANGNDGFYDHMTIYITDGTGSGQVRLMDDYVGSTFVAEVHPDWKTNPDATSVYTIIAYGEIFAHELGSEALVNINAEIVDALGVDTLSELSQAIPAATPTIKTALMLLYMIARNKLTTTSSELGIHNDAGTKIIKKDLADNGVTYTEDEMESGA